VQVLWYFVWDRLPALAYAGGLVRFGGGLDDPNGFGVMTVLPILLVITMWREFRRWQHAAGLLAALAVMAFLTLSFSTAAALMAGLLALAPIMRRPRILLGVLGGVLLAAALALTSGYVRGVIDAKSRSAWGRLDLHGKNGRPGLADHLGDLDVVSLLFGAPRTRVVTEIGYVEVFANFGLIGLALLTAALVVALRRGVFTAQAARATGDLRIARLYEGLSAYLVAFSVGSLGIPYFGVMPVNLVFWVVAVLAALGPHLLQANPAAR
jgi:O-antigen ligase